MWHKVGAIGVLLCGTMCAAPVQITITLGGGNFDSGVTTTGVDTGSTFTTSAAACTGAGCASLSSITGLNALLSSFTVPTGSLTGSGSVLSGSLVQASNLSGFTFTGESAFNANSNFTENVSATGVLGTVVALTGTYVLNWSGNSAVQARAATGTITLTGDVSAVPEPSTALLLSFPVLALIWRKVRARKTAHS